MPSYPIPTVVSPYMDINRFLRRWGYVNVAKHSNKDVSTGQQNPQINVPALQDAIDYGVDEINNTLRGGVLKIPLNLSPRPVIVDSWNAVISYVFLYLSRGLEESDKVGQRLKKLEEMQYMDMIQYKAGNKLFDAANSPAYETASDGTGVQDCTATPVYIQDVWWDMIGQGWWGWGSDRSPIFPGGSR